MTTKTPKRKGPIRFEAIVPVSIVIILFCVYFKFFFDSHLRKALEFTGTYVHGAEVNIGSLRLSLIDMQLRIGKVQITNKSEPDKNIIEVGKIKFDLLWDGLLRGKMVIPQAGIEEVKYQAKRNRPGRITKNKKDSAAYWTEKAEDTAIKELEEQGESNMLGELMALVGGQNYNDRLKNIEGNLKASQKIKELDKELKEKKIIWDKRIKELPDATKLKAFANKVKNFKFNSKGPMEIKRSLETLDGFHKKIKSDIKNIETAQKAFKADFGKYKNTAGTVEKYINEDIKSLQNKLNIPSLNTSDLAKSVFGKLFADKLRLINHYMKIAREYMPAEGDKKADDELKPHERKKGKNFRFPKNKSYPMFWLQKAVISSSNTNSQFLGNIEGLITNVTDDPVHLGEPAKLNLKGDFPSEKIRGIQGVITIDHTTDVSKETADFTVLSFPVGANTISKSDDIDFGYNKAIGTSKVLAKLENQRLDISMDNVFSEVDYKINAKNKDTERLLIGIAKGLSKLTLNAKATGSWNDLNLNLNSNLGAKIQEAFKKQVQAEINRAKSQIKAHVNGLIDKEKQKLYKERDKLEKQFGVSLKSKEAAINSIKKRIKDEKNKAKNREKKKLENKAKKEGQKLLDGLKGKFKF